MLNASQNRTNRAPLTEELMSMTPALTLGWLATIPMDWPLILANDVIMFGAQRDWTSRSSPPSTTLDRISFISYVLSSSPRRIVLSCSFLPAGGRGFAGGGLSML